MPQKACIFDVFCDVLVYFYDDFTLLHAKIHPKYINNTASKTLYGRPVSRLQCKSVKKSVISHEENKSTWKSKDYKSP